MPGPGSAAQQGADGDQREASTRTRSAMARRATSLAGASISNMCGTPGRRWNSTSTPALLSYGGPGSKMAWVPTRRQITCGTPGRCSSPYCQVARPSGAQVIS